MKNKVVYEWGVEEKDEYEDIIDCSFWDTLKEAKAHIPEHGNYDICLVRNEFNPIDEDLEDRQWAYIIDGELGEFEDAKIPQRFLKEFEKNR